MTTCSSNTYRRPSLTTDGKPTKFLIFVTMIKVFTSFSGYDSQCLALNRLPIDYDLVGWSEIDRYAIEAHNALFPQWADRNYGDITKIDWSQVPDFDLFTYSSPCQDFSQAGLQKGGVKGSGTRSSLLWECERAIREKRPKYLLMENVAALVTDKFVKLFNQWQLTLERMGYKNFAKVLNAKDYGVPQNRERIFLVSILDNDARFEFPKPQKLCVRLKDVLDGNVDEQYYLSDTQVEIIINSSFGQESGRIQETEGVCGTLRARDYKGPLCVKEPIIGAVRTRSYCGKPMRLELGGSVANTLTSVQKDNLVIEPCFRVRKLTEREYFRLMDLTDADIDKIQNAGISRTQQYKMAGNSIVVAVLREIFNKMLVNTEITELKLFY